jgi:hypothetical protein
MGNFHLRDDKQLNKTIGYLFNSFSGFMVKSRFYIRTHTHTQLKHILSSNAEFMGSAI